MSKNPDIILELPPLADASAAEISKALVQTTKAMIAAGYEPPATARALLITGASMLAEFAGPQVAETVLRELITKLAARGA